MEKFKSTNDDVDVIVNEYGDDEELDEEEEEDEEELYVVIYTVEINLCSPAMVQCFNGSSSAFLLQPTADDEISIDSHGCILQSLASSFFFFFFE